MKRCTLLVLLFISAAAAAQNSAPSENAGRDSWLPRPVLLAGPSAVGNGYQTVAWSGGAGLLLTSPHLLSDFEARYMNARKTNDNTVNNQRGMSGSLRGACSIPFGADYISVAELNGARPRPRTTKKKHGVQLSE